MKPAAKHWPLAAAWLLLLVLTTALGAAAVRAAGGHLVYALDDTYIQMAIGRQLAAHGVWGVTRYEFSGAGSSLLWPLALAAVDRIAGPAERAPFVLNAIAAAALLWLAYAVLRRHVANRALQALTLVMLVVAVPLAVLPIVGMEHALEAVVTLALAAAGVRSCSAVGSGERRRMFRWTLIAAALTVAVRYDAASVLVVLVVMSAVTRGWRQAAAIALTGASPALAYGLVARSQGWPMLPSAVLMKQRLAGVSVLTWHGFLDVFGGGALTALAYAPWLLVLVLAAVAQLARGEEGDAPRARERRLLLVLFVCATLVHVQFGRLGWLYRYEAYLVALGIVANAASAGRWVPAIRRSPRPLQLAACVLLAVLTLHPLLLRGFLAAREALVDVDDLYRHEYQLAQFFRRYPTDGALLVGDIGAIAYFSDTPLVDAGGLATIELLEQARENRYDRDLVLRVSRARGARVSIAGNPGGAGAAWTCVAEWKARLERRPEATFFHAADADAAASLERNLRAFATEDAGRETRLAFATAITRSCASPR